MTPPGRAAGAELTASHLDPWHPDIECRTFDIEHIFDIEDFDIECSMLIDIDDFFIRYRVSIWNTFHIEGHISRFRRSREQIDIEVSYFSISTKNSSILYYDIVYDIEGLFHVRYRRSLLGSILYTI